MTVDTIENLTSRYDELNIDIKVVEDKIKILNQDLHALKMSRQAITTKLKELRKKEKKIVISDHALLRYIERVYNIDLNELKEEIITAEVKGNKLFTQDGTRKIQMENQYGKFEIVLKDDTVVTIQKVITS